MPSAPRSANRIIATAIALMVLVCSVVGVLGWRLLSQEEALVRQQARERLERTADQMVSKFTSRMRELDSWLGRNVPLSGGTPPTTGGAIVVWFSQNRVDVAPIGRLLYYPTTTTATTEHRDVAGVFTDADRLESANQLADAASVLQTLTRSYETSIQVEARLRLARVLGKLGRIDDALATYDMVDNLLGAADLLLKEGVMNRGMMELLVRSDPGQYAFFPIPGTTSAPPDSALRNASRLATMINAKGVPYRLLSQFERAQLLASSGRRDDAREHARRLVSEITSGRWRLTKDTFTFYDSAARKIAGLEPPLPTRVAVAEQVESLWNDWLAFQAGAKFTVTRVHRGGATPLIALVNVNASRLAALIADGNSIGSLGLDLGAAGESVRASIVDEQGQQIGEQTSQAPGLEVMRSLSGGGIPWQLKLVGSLEETSTIVRARRRYAIPAFSIFVLLVAGACYAIARGVLREANAGRLQGDFVSAVSHEFRSPLTALRQLTELLAQGRIQDESRRRMYFDVLLKETSRLNQLVEDLLDFGRMDAGRRQYHFEPIELSRLVDDAIQEYQREADANGHRIEFAPHSGQVIVNADRGAMKRVVRNLLENAVKYSPNALIVSVETGSEERSAVLRVRDEGMGIPLDEQSRIFEKFVRGEAAKSACIQGTGIGLSMVKEIVAAHRGHVSVQSDVGRGSTFVVRLPLSEADERRPA